MICDNCKHAKTDIPEDLENYADLASALNQLKKMYSKVYYCDVFGTLVVSNDGNPAQEKDKCDNFESE